MMVWKDYVKASRKFVKFNIYIQHNFDEYSEIFRKSLDKCIYSMQKSSVSNIPFVSNSYLI